MISRLRFTRAYHTTAKRYVRHLNARPPCIFDVVQSGSMAKAAAQLRVKQPSVSDRSPQGIRPTIYGDALIECGVAVFDQLKQGIGKIEFLSDPTTAEVRIGCVPSMAATLLPSVIRRSASARPSGSSRLGRMPKSVWGHGPPSGQSPTRQEDP